MSIVTILLFIYVHFTWFLPTQIWTVIYIIYFLRAVRNWMKLYYYLTAEYCVVQNGKTYYRMPYYEIRKKEYKMITNFVEKIFGCATIQYGKFLGYHSARGSNSNLWRETARFWCIRDYKKVNRIICKYTEE